MGRSRSRPRSAEDDPSQRSKRRSSTSNAQNTDATHTELDKVRGSLFHCNYCNKDISGMIRLKCAICPDFDLCAECFSVGTEVNPHKCNHPYKVMDNLSFPFICSDWTADEEMMILEGIEMYGFGNWHDVAVYIGTKTQSQCIDHYNAVYMNSPYFPLADMSRVVGKSREELLAMAKELVTGKNELPASVGVAAKGPSSISGEIKNDDHGKEDSTTRCPSSTLNVVASSCMISSGDSKSLDALEKNAKLAANNNAPSHVELEGCQTDKGSREKNPKPPSVDGPCLTELSGYNPKRQEFDVEYDNDAEQLLADMEFKDTDSDAEHQLKLQVIRIYSKRLDERKRRKDFILERNLLGPNSFEKNLPHPQAKEIYQRYKVFARFHSKEDHENLMQNLIDEYDIVKRMNDLQEARNAGCVLVSDANKYIEQKRRKVSEERLVDGMDADDDDDGDGTPCEVVKSGFPRRAKDSCLPFTTQEMPSCLVDWDITGHPGADLLSEHEKHVCSELRMLPSHYLSVLHQMYTQMKSGAIASKSEAHHLFKVEPSKVDVIYDILVQRGWAVPPL